MTLDTGKCPRWLFERMVKLGREMTRVLIEEYGPDEYIRRLSDPAWFQSLGTVLAFDWNASGLTTILTAALKEAMRGREREFGVVICGGKGKTSRKTPDEIKQWGHHLSLPASHTENLIYNSRMSAKVDSALVQDGFQIYHHSFFFSLPKKGTCPHTYIAQYSVAAGPHRDAITINRRICSRCGHEEGKPQRNISVGGWTVVQQGMNQEEQTARRYHWHSAHIKDLVCEPHAAISSEVTIERMLNLIAESSSDTRGRSTELVQSGYKPLIKEINLIRKHTSELSRMVSVESGGEQLTLLKLEDREFHYHPVVHEDFSKSRYLEKILARLTENKPKNYEKLVGMEGVGPKTVRALALVAEVIYGAKPSYEDPARYSFAHGGKDATPYPVDRRTYDTTISMLERAVQRTRISPFEKSKAIRRLVGSRSSLSLIRVRDPDPYEAVME